MKASTRKIKNYKIQTLVYSHAFIFSVQVIVFLMSRPPIIVMIISWAISALGATVIILFAFQRIESIQIKLDQHLIRSRQFSQRQTALASLSGIFATLQSVDQICEELAKRLHDIQGFDYVSVYLLNKHTPDRILRAYAGDDDLPNPLTIQPGIGLSEQPILDGNLQYIPDVTENPKYSSGYGKGAEIDIPIQGCISDEEAAGLAPYGGVVTTCTRMQPKQAVLKLFGIERRVEISATDPSIVFEVEVDTIGDTEIEASFVNADGSSQGAYYLYAELVE